MYSLHFASQSCSRPTGRKAKNPQVERSRDARLNSGGLTKLYRLRRWASRSFHHGVFSYAPPSSSSSLRTTGATRLENRLGRHALLPRAAPQETISTSQRMTVHSRPPVDNPPAHSSRLWTASLPRGTGICPPAPRGLSLRADAPRWGLPQEKIRLTHHPPAGKSKRSERLATYHAHGRERVIDRQGGRQARGARVNAPACGGLESLLVDHKKARSSEPCWARVSRTEPVIADDTPACHS